MFTHRRQVGQQRNTGNVVHHDACRIVTGLGRVRPTIDPLGKRFDIRATDGHVVFMPERVLQQDLQGVRQPRGTSQSGCFRFRQTPDRITLSMDLELILRTKTIHGRSPVISPRA